MIIIMIIIIRRSLVGPLGVPRPARRRQARPLLVLDVYIYIYIYI